MIPAAFEYTRAGSLDEALELVAPGDPSIRVLAGGQSLIPVMKLRLARPTRLVDLGRLDDLRGVRDLPGGGLAIGAMTTWAALLADPRVTTIGALADALPTIGDVQVRNRGTIGGSLAHADPASDIAAPALALGVELVARSAARGERAISIADFFAGPFATALAPDEILFEVRIPARSMPSASAGHVASAYRALPQLASGYPIAGVAIVVERSAEEDASNDVVRCSVAVTGVGEQPYRAAGVEAAILAGAAAADALATIADGQRVNVDIHADREFRAAMAAVMARRALEAALAR